MYRYDEFDRDLVLQRAQQFRRQVKRRLAGELDEDQFKPLRLMNGLYLQLHAYMLRITVPYGCLRSDQLRKLAHIARTYDKGYGHLTTRQNMQFNWIELARVPDLLEELAEVEMHCIQSSGNCIRNTTSDEYAGVAADEIEDPRVYCEIIRQWSTLHPEFCYLPRKFKISVSAASRDRAAIRLHDVGLRVHRNEAGEPGFEVFVGGGLGRTPYVGKSIRQFLPVRHMLSYLEAILRVYNLLGRRDNKFKARIKILVDSLGAEAFGQRVEEEWEAIRDSALTLPREELDRIRAYFAPPAYRDLDDTLPEFEEQRRREPDFDRWFEANVVAHKRAGYAIVNVTAKPVGKPPGDIDAEQMEAVAALADRFGFGELRITHNQNLVLPNVEKRALFALWQELDTQNLATPNHNLINDAICCPGMDFCALATTRSIPIAERLSERFADPDRQREIGELFLNISGCINACGHHHVGNIGIVGVDKRGDEFYQLMLGGAADDEASLAQILGPGFDENGIVDAVETVVGIYLDLRKPGERFIDCYRRVGRAPFKESLYGAA